MDPIAVTVIGGYLGSGKTTLLNQVLRQADGRRIAVLVNDFGNIGIAGDLIAAADGDTITLTNGCVCCQIGSDLMTALWSIRDREHPPSHVIIEASGIADPVPIANHALTPGSTSTEWWFCSTPRRCVAGSVTPWWAGPSDGSWSPQMCWCSTRLTW